MFVSGNGTFFQNLLGICAYIFVVSLFFAFWVIFVTVACLSVKWLVVMSLACIVYINIDKFIFGLVNRRWDFYHKWLTRAFHTSSKNSSAKIIVCDEKIDEPTLIAPIDHNHNDFWNMKFLTKLDKKQRCIYSMHPHGIFFFGSVILFAHFEKVFGSHVSTMVDSNAFNQPLYREHLMWLGAIPATKEAARKAAANDENIMVVPGGVAEIFETEKDNITHLFLKSRRGFIRLSLELGLPLRPVFTFGENRLFKQVQWGLEWRRKWSRKLHLPLFFFYGSKYIPFYPDRVPLNIVVGPPIPVTKTQNPSKEQVEELYERYEASLKELHDTWREKVGGYSGFELMFK